MYNESRDKDIVIEGHTCNLGSDAYNLELSRKRALSVLKYLVQVEHIPEDRIRIEYYGERYPVATNIDERGREMNRRVDIRFLPGATKTALSRSISPSKTVQ
jgi:OOP family OmpA-OmpF porin